MSSEQPSNNPGTFRPPSFDDNLGADVTSPGTMSLGVGQKVFGHFTLKRLLGQGAMGMVWLAHNGNLNREVALKFLPQVLASDSLVLDELRRETLRCLDLSHHHIVRVYGLELGEAGTGAGGKLAAIHMEFVDGLTLRELMHKRVKEEGKAPIFEVREITAWVNQLCDALHYAHTKAKVAHRDLKPSNIMVNSAGEAKLADFGVARKIVDNLAQVTNLIVGTGTTAYMSPQQMNGGVPHPTDDVYSLGATIFELLTSKPPFFSGDMRHQVSQVAPVTMTERREQLGFTDCEPIPEVWEQTVAACLAKSPEERPQSCEDVAKMLKGEPLTAAAVSFDKRGPATQRPARPAARPAGPAPEAEPRKGFPLVPVAAGVVVLLALVGGGIWWKGRPDKGGSPVPGSAAPASPEAKAPVPAAPQFGSFFVESTPPGAMVILDNRFIRNTPTNFSDVAIGAHKLIFRMDGYEQHSQEVMLKEGELPEIKVTLKRQSGELRVESKPAAAKFVVRSLQADGAVLEGETPLKTNLVIGRYAITLQRPGHADFTSTNSIERDNPVQIAHEFPEGALDIRSTPPGVTFEVFRGTNRMFTGLTPTNFTGLPAGSYQVKMSKAGFKPFDDAIAVTKGGTSPVNWDSTDKLVRGGFTITTEPPGAIATIPDQAPKLTPASFSQLAPGKYNVTFTLENYEPQTREVDVKGDESPNLGTNRLERSTGTLLVSSKPPGATYEVTPVNVLGPRPAAVKGSTKAAPESLKLPTGTYKVVLSRPGWPGFTREEISVLRNGSSPLSHEFEEGSLSVVAQPGGAKFTVNGKPADKFPMALPPGPVMIIASLSGRTLTNNVALEKDQPLKVEMMFPASLSITSDPKGAEVLLNGKVLGKADPKFDLASVAPGAVKLEFRHDGYQTRASEIPVKPGEAKQFKITLVKEPAKTTQKPPEPVATLPPTKPVQVAKVNLPAPPKAGGVPTAATKQWQNSLGMEFIAVPGVKGLLCVHETRVQDYKNFAKEKELSWEPLTTPTTQGPDHPAVNITWPNAHEFCDWLTDKERKAGTISAQQSYRLPTDLEWSAAVGLGEEKGASPLDRVKNSPKDKAPWGTTKDVPPPKGAGNYGAAAGSDDFAGTAPVKSFKANEAGLYDLGGNAWEWCEDQFAGSPGVYVLRGGSWKTEPFKAARPTIAQLLSGARFPGSVGLDDTGFRIVLDTGK